MNHESPNTPDFIELSTGAGTIKMSVHAQPRDYIPFRLFGTDYEFGLLEVTVERDGPPEWLADTSGPNDRWQTHHSIPVVSHPRRGALVVETAWASRAIDGRARFAEVYDRAETYCEWIRDELKGRRRSGGPHPHWHDRELPLGPAVAFGGSEASSTDLSGLAPAPEVVLDANAWESLPAELEEAMDHHAGSIDRASSCHPKHLSAALKTLGGPEWTYVEHVDCAACPQWPADQLFDNAES